MNVFAQWLVAIALIVVVTLIHGTGVVLSAKIFQYEDRELKRKRLAVREFTLMVPMALFLVALHMLEIAVFAAFYLAAGEAADLSQAMVMSGLAYSTMGTVDGTAGRWPLLVAFEGLAGFLMIGWSAAVFVTDMEKVLRRDR